MRNIIRKLNTKNPFFLIKTIVVILVIALVVFMYIRKTTAKHALPEEFTIEFGDGVNMEFVLINSGSFMMGSSEQEGDSDETPRHKVTITKPFYLGKYEVTQEQWKKVMGNNPSSFRGNDNPVDTVSWKDCIAFTEKLSSMMGRKLTLPSEAQWEYACRAGSIYKWFYVADDLNAGDYGWIDSNSGGTTHPVGLKEPNEWGLYDMYGNIQEWCLDWYQNPYADGEAVDPSGPKEGDSRVIRGGGWGDFLDNARSSYRNANGENEANDGTGFRCVLYLDE
jgi:formylglycine-generating enzyme required for sulfatase activity